MNKLVVAVYVLSLLLVGTLGFVGYSYYSSVQFDKQVTAYQEGGQAGYEEALAQVFQQAQSCQQVPLTIENNTINMIAVECLQQQAPEAVVE
ncbi:hypothetical protein HN903_00255 [archaeon]|nr:hypothetical protein [archaeon]MBT7128169.1 hypothetical protein [archaeon]